jgi:hypothetical protein
MRLRPLLKTPPRMESPTELHTAYDEVLKKIGRNLLLFQQAELLIKRLRSIGSYSARSGEACESIKKHDSACEKMTLGQVVNLFVDHHCINEPPAPESSSAAGSHPIPGDARFSIHFTFGGPDGYPEARRLALAKMVEQRNELVHQLLPKLDRNSLESCRQMGGYLDEQRLGILPEIHFLQEDLKNVKADLETICNHLSSPRGMEQLSLPEIQRSSLITNLAAIAGESTDPDGWTPLGPAIKRLQDFPRQMIDSLCAQFGLKSLTQVLETSQRFDLLVEQSGKGGHRTLYRLKTMPIPADSVPPMSMMHPRANAEHFPWSFTWRFGASPLFDSRPMPAL